jgi:hypothetical protein
MEACGKDIRVRGSLIRIAQLEGDKYEFLDDPEAVLNELRSSRIRIDLFTFMQRLPETSPKYAYPMEWDNLAVLPVSTFDHSWKEQIGFKARNKAKQAMKKGAELREVPFVDLPRYYVPLTPLGQIAFDFGLHHRLADRVPESLASKLRDLRRTWYSLRFPPVKEA